MVTPAQALTAQFYAWEQRGRGWHLSEHVVELEPVFEPFWGHSIPGDIIDDGKHPHWLASLFEADISTAQTVHTETPVIAFQSNTDSELTVFTVTLPKHDKVVGNHIEQLLVMISYRATPMSFELIASITDITIQWACLEKDANFVYSQLKAFFPDVHVAERDEDKIFVVIEDATALYTVDFGLEEEFMRPLASGANHEPLIALFGIFEQLRDEQCAIVQILFSGAVNPWPESIVTSVTDQSGRNSFFIDEPNMVRLAHEKVAKPLCAVSVRAVACSDELADAQEILTHVATALTHASASPHNRLVPLVTITDVEYTVSNRLADIIMRQSHRTGMLLNVAELATFVHYPATSLRSKKLFPETRTTKAAQAFLIGQPYVLGDNIHNGLMHQVGLPLETRTRHMHIMGATGTGKSTLLHSLIMQDIAQGNGLMVLDPHGDLIASILSNIPESRIHDVVLIDPSDSDFPIAFNILAAHSDIEKELLASDLVTLFKRFSTSWGDQMHSVLANALLALLYNTKTYHLGDLRKFLIEPAVRNTILATVTDPDISYYWHKEFPILKGGSIGPLITRLDSFLRPRVIRNMVCQEQGLDMAHLMDSQKIVLVKLAQGLVGTENSYLLGAFLVSKLQQTAMARQSQAAMQRVPFFCYIDEFQHFITPSMASILSGARKYMLGLVLAHQDMQQVTKYDTEIAGSVLANAATRICFRLGDTDAKRMQEGFASFSADDFQNLRVGEAIVRVNTADCDFSLSVSPYATEDIPDGTEAIIAHSRKSYGAPVPAPTQVTVTEPLPVVVVPVTVSTPKPIPAKVESPKQETVREHRYIQAYIKKMAESYGYRASIEVPTPTGDGLVDVLLEKDDTTIAVEVSVTTPAAWELHNVQKCLAAGYGKVIVCTDQPNKRKAILSRINEQLPARDHAKITVLASTDIHTLFIPQTPATPPEMIHKGYRVKVQYEQSANRDTLIQSIVNATRKPST